MHQERSMTPSPIPAMIYGTAWKKKMTKNLVIQAIEAGFKGIDTACQPKHYDEAEVGHALKELSVKGFARKQLYVQTKFTPLDGQDPNAVPYDKLAPIELQVAQSFERSLTNLQTSYLDALLLHSPIFPHAQMLQAWKTFETFYESGKVKQLGLSNCYDLKVLQKLYDEATIKPTILQNRFYDQTNYDTEIRAWCAHHNITYQSFWTLTANPHILTSFTLTTLSQKYDKSSSQIFFRFLTQQGIVPLTGTTSLEHMKADLEIFDFTLLDTELQSIEFLLSS